MDIRELMNRKPGATILSAVFVLAGALGIWLWGSKGRDDGPLAFYYDMNRGVLVVDDAGKAAPLEEGYGTYAYPDGTHGAVVRATIYAGSELPADTIVAGMTPEAVESAGAVIGALQRMGPDGQTSLVADVEDLTWHPNESAGALAIYQRVSERFDGQRPVQITPE